MSRRRSPYRILAVCLLIGYLLASVAYVWMSALWVTRWHPHFRVADLLAPRANDVVIFTFFLVVGASVGSFLNVVVWRLPQRLNVNGHSFCPRCRNQLRARDNVPIFGWLWLSGRCRDCRLPISSRYPIVETLVGITFAVVGATELTRWSLPYVGDSVRSNWLSTPFVDADLLTLILYHVVALATAWAAGLIRFDGNPLPPRLTLFAAVTLVGGMFALPQAMVVPWQLVGDSVPSMVGAWPPTGWMTHGGDWSVTLVQIGLRLLTSLVAAGFFARVLAKSFCPSADMKMDPLGSSTRRLIDLMVLIAVPAIVVGWQAVMGVILVAAIFAKILETFAFAQSRDSLGRFAVSLPVALSVQLLLWRGLVASHVWPSEQASQLGLIVSFFGVLAIPLWLDENGESFAPMGDDKNSSEIADHFDEDVR
ncbi:A24 family peptidase [Rhodopirellula sp. P2]|uniref:A24 family peptidase n=1 Tax=Rhodopirellula sp. P2 TaxID=2127060 RepID=UPI002367FEC8|nr:A24 family peptidase [Rhodopirellula sp. P2]WDQ18233.1 prepilin peptidase [Rhodopirellula sp. P2]